MKIIYNIEKLKKEAKRLKDLSFDEECSFEVSRRLQLQAKDLENRIYFISMLRKHAEKKEVKPDEE